MLVQFVNDGGDIVTIRANETLDRLLVAGVVKEQTHLRDGTDGEWQIASGHPITRAFFLQTKSLETSPAQAPKSQEPNERDAPTSPPPAIIGDAAGPTIRGLTDTATSSETVKMETQKTQVHEREMSRLSTSPAVEDTFSFLFSFQGRITCRQYWARWLTLFIIQIVAIILLSGVWSLALIATLILTIGAFSAMVRRLHDIGQPGHWSLLSLVPVAGLAGVIVLGLISGSSGHNQYGPAPRE